MAVIRKALELSHSAALSAGATTAALLCEEALRDLDSLEGELAACSRLGGKLSEDCIRMRDEVTRFADSFPGYSHEWQSVQDLAKRVSNG